MRFLNFTPQRERLILLLWGLIFAKCFIVEHYVQAYDVPVNSWLYVWALSVSMATVATIAFWRLRSTEHLPPRIPRALLTGWVLCLVLAALLSIIARFTPVVQLTGLIFGFSVILGGGYIWQALHSRAFLDWIPAAGWCLGAGLQHTIAPGHALLGFGIGLLAFVVVPLAAKLLVDWYQGKAAVRALYIANDI